MATWTPPPEFGPMGSPPPEFAYGWLVEEKHFLHKNPRGGPWAIARLVRETSPPLELVGARGWLLENLGTESLELLEERQERPPSGSSNFTLPMRLSPQGMNMNMNILRENLRRRVAVNASPALQSSGGGQELASTLRRLYGEVELRQIQHSVSWKRVDIFRIPPGVTRRWVKSNTFGITNTDAMDLSASLGLGGGVASLAQLSTQINATLSRSVNLSSQHESTEELTLANDSHSGYRLFAIWQRLEVIKVSRLATAPLARLPPAWVTVKQIEFAPENALDTTYTDV